MSPAAWRDDEDDWDEDPEWSEEGDPDETDVIACPKCGGEIYEDAERCPLCGEYVTRSASALEGRPGWYVVLAVLGVIGTIIVLSGLAGWLR